MSAAEHEAFVRDYYSHLPTRDIKQVLADDAAVEVLQAKLRPRVSDDFHILLVGPGFSERYEGLDGFVEGWRAWSEPYERYLVDFDEPVGRGYYVLVDVVQRAVPRGTAGEIVTAATALWVFEAGDIRRIEFHLDRQVARELAGLA